MARWFRFYSDAIRNPKVAVLPDADFRLWVELMAVAAENDGAIPSYDALKHLLNRRIDRLQSGVMRLVIGGLIDPVGDAFEPHNWRKFQYKSDTSTDRVKRFRGVTRNGDETPPDTETDIPVAKATGAAPDSDKEFWDGAVSYLGGKRSLIGKWVKDYGKPQTALAITAAQLDRAVDPVAFVERTLRNGAQANVVAIGI